MKYVKKHCVLMEGNVNMWMKSIRTHQLRSLRTRFWKRCVPRIRSLHDI